MSPNNDACDFPIAAQPSQIAGGGIVMLTADLPLYDATYDVEWEVRGPTELSAQDVFQFTIRAQIRPTGATS